MKMVNKATGEAVYYNPVLDQGGFPDPRFRKGHSVKTKKWRTMRLLQNLHPGGSGGSLPEEARL